MAVLAIDHGPVLGTAEEADATATGTAVVSDPTTAATLTHPLRRRILEALAAPGSATTVADQLDAPRQKVNYHLRQLEKAGLVEQVGTRQRRGLTERLVRATASHYLVAPDTLDAGQAPTARRDAQDLFSATFQVATAARTIREVAALADLAREAGQRLTTLTLDTEITFATPAAREQFANDLVTTIQRLVATHSQPTSPNGRPYRLVINAHPVYRPTSTTEEKTS